METGRQYWNDLINDYQVRMTMKQKDKFIGFLTKFLEERGLKHETETHMKGKLRNLTIGDVDNAEVVFSAHYDTPPNAVFPIVNVVGGVLKWTIFQFVYVFVLLGFFTAICLAVGLLTRNFALMMGLWSFLSFGYCIQMSMGFANKNTLNDNTSGVAMILALIDRMQDELKAGKIAFVLFDWEERGLVGAKKFSNIHPDIKLINFACISAGDELVFVNKKAFTDNVVQHVPSEKLDGKNIATFPAMKMVYTSDQLMFKNSMAIASLTKIPVVGYALFRAHTFLDTKFDTKNMEIIEDTMVNYVRNTK